MYRNTYKSGVSTSKRYVTSTLSHILSEIISTVYIIFLFIYNYFQYSVVFIAIIYIVISDSIGSRWYAIVDW